MVDVDAGVGRILLVCREDPAMRRTTVLVAVLVLLISFVLAYASRMGHFYVLSLSSIALVAWTWGWRRGVLAGVAVPLLAAPVSVGYGVPPAAVVQDTAGFFVVALICGGGVGLGSSLFGHAVAASRAIAARKELLPICSYCHKIRDENEQWLGIETYFRRHTETRLTHGICPTCLERHWPECGGSDD